MNVHLVDGTYELFRHFYAVPPRRNAAGAEVAAVSAVLRSVAGMLREGATHLGVATDHVLESFRNDMFGGYKTGAGVDPDLLAQFVPLEDGLRALGVTVWAMVELEADDAMAAAAAIAAGDSRVEQVLLCTPDKDLAQCVRGTRVVQLNRRTGAVLDEEGVIAKFGVAPPAIPDYLALVGDSADGYPGIAGFGAKTAAAVLRAFGSIDAIPGEPGGWPPGIRGAPRLCATLAAHRDEARFCKDLATLRTDVDPGSVDQWRWRGPGPELAAVCESLEAPDLAAALPPAPGS